MNLTDLERQLDAACGGKSLDEMKGQCMKLDLEGELEVARANADLRRESAVAFEVLTRLKRIRELTKAHIGPMAVSSATIAEILRLCGVEKP